MTSESQVRDGIEADLKKATFWAGVGFAFCALGVLFQALYIVHGNSRLLTALAVICWIIACMVQRLESQSLFRGVQRCINYLNE